MKGLGYNYRIKLGSMGHGPKPVGSNPGAYVIVFPSISHTYDDELHHDNTLYTTLVLPKQFLGMGCAVWFAIAFPAVSQGRNLEFCQRVSAS